MAITPLQVVHATPVASATSISRAYSQTVAGSLLVAVLAVKQRGADVTISRPSGWNVACELSEASLAGPRLLIAYRENAPSATTITFSWGSTALDAAMTLYELGGAMTSGAFDRPVINQGTSTAPASGNTAQTSQAEEFIIAAIANRNTGSTQGTFTGGHNLRHEHTTPNSTAHMTARMTVHDRALTAQATHSIGCTLTGGAREWVAGAATFKAATAQHVGEWQSTESSDTQSATGQSSFKGALSSTEGADSQSATGKISFQGAFASTEEDEWLSTTYNPAGIWNSTEGDDELNTRPVFIGTWSSNEDEEFLPIGEQDDWIDAFGKVRYIAPWESSESPDLAEFSGRVSNIGRLSAQEEDDTIKSVVFTSYEGVLNAKEDDDTIDYAKRKPRGLYLMGLTFAEKAKYSFGYRVLGFPESEPIYPGDIPAPPPAEAVDWTASRRPLAPGGWTPREDGEGSS